MLRRYTYSTYRVTGYTKTPASQNLRSLLPCLPLGSLDARALLPLQRLNLWLTGRARARAIVPITRHVRFGVGSSSRFTPMLTKTIDAPRVSHSTPSLASLCATIGTSRRCRLSLGQHRHANGRQQRSAARSSHALNLRGRRQAQSSLVRNSFSSATNPARRADFRSPPVARNRSCRLFPAPERQHPPTPHAR